MFRKTYLLWDLMALISVTILNRDLQQSASIKKNSCKKRGDTSDCIDNGARPVYEVEEFALVKERASENKLS